MNFGDALSLFNHIFILLVCPHFTINLVHLFVCPKLNWIHNLHNCIICTVSRLVHFYTKIDLRYIQLQSTITTLFKYNSPYFLSFILWKIQALQLNYKIARAFYCRVVTFKLVFFMFTCLEYTQLWHTSTERRSDKNL